MNFGNKHLVRSTHPRVFVYYSLIIKIKDACHYGFQRGPDPWEQTAKKCF